MNRELQNLKIAIKLFHDLTGGPSPQLCQYLLKVIDFFEPDINLPAETNQLTTQILIAIAEGVHEHHPNERLHHSIAWSRDKLTDPDAFMILHHDIKLALRDESTCLQLPQQPSTPPATSDPPTNVDAESY